MFAFNILANLRFYIQTCETRLLDHRKFIIEIPVKNFPASLPLLMLLIYREYVERKSLKGFFYAKKIKVEKFFQRA